MTSYTSTGKTSQALRRPQWLARACATGLLAVVGLSHAALTDLAPVPLITSSPQVVKPNLMFILDDSGSMAWSFMPDTVEGFARTSGGTAKYGYVSPQCNGVYYNPATLYTPPISVASDGTVSTYPNASFTAARVNGYNTSSSTVDLSTSFRAWTDADVSGFGGLNGNPATAEPAFYYRYTGSQTTAAQRLYLDTSSTFYSECNSTVGSTPGSGVFTKVVVSATSGTAGVGAGVDERTNFANWYSYYRTRMLMMKSATGRAFNSIGSEYRVGYMSINNNVSPSFLNIADFTASQRYAWYTKLYGANPDNSTPLRRALSDAGRIYAGTATTMYGQAVTDPVQYSCQKNFSILSTDGYWNSGGGYQIDGSTAIGNQDAGLPRPYNDGGASVTIYTATITVSSSVSTDNISSITVDGQQILSSVADSSGGGWGTRSSKLATKIVNRINACTAAITGNCQVAGYSAIRSGNTITIYAPSAVTGSPAFTANGGASATVTPFVTSSSATAGVSDTLADVAAYYYYTDLRTSGSVATNNVVPGGDDDATHQHMTTYTVGLGQPGRMIYSPSYKTDTTGHYAAVRDGADATTGACPWQSSGTCTWPTPASGQPENIDDMWHAAVNGRGTYFSASNASALAVGLVSALQSITAITSDSAAASTSNPNITSGDNYVFSSTFRTAEWYGELERRQIDPVTGVLSTTPDWTAASQLDSNTSRTIYTFDDSTGSTTKLKSFEWSNLTTAEQAYFTSSYIGSTASPILSQFCSIGEICLTSAAQTAAGGAPLVAYLRGDRTNEGPGNDTSRYFRQRSHVLGDIVNSEAVYVNRPQFDYVDAGYSTFKTTGIATTRNAMVYVGANDGMLHAFDANTGAEAWAYIPKMLMPSLYRLADKNYASNHQYYVDGSPTVADVYFGGSWRTILVGGLNAGGRGYYALDITNPASPRALWEFTDTNMGYSFGRPEITKLADGTWVVLLTSGYNNVNSGNGQGYLYVLNAGTGAVIRTIGTGAGSDSAAVSGVCATAPCPSGLAQIRAWVDNPRYDNTTTRVYGGDLFGNLWRFDVNGNIGASGYDAQQLATLRGPSGGVQSMTARPELGLVSGYPVVFVGTGRYLGATDLQDTATQSIYAIKDNGGSTSFGNPRSDISATGFVQQTLTESTCGTSDYCVTGTRIRTGSTNAVNFAVHKGWFVDLPSSGERANTDPQLALGTLAITTNVLDPTACSVGGYSFINFFDYRTGQAVSTANGMVSVFLDSAIATRTVLIRLRDSNGGAGDVNSITRTSDGSTPIVKAPVDETGGGTRRTSWRELVTE